MATLEAVVLRAKLCPDCGHPNPYQGNYPDGDYPAACLACGEGLAPIDARVESLGELARSEPFTIDDPEPEMPRGFLNELADAWRRGWKGRDE